MVGDAWAIAARSGAISVGTENPGSQSSWWRSSSRVGRSGGHLRPDELGQRALDRLAVDVAAAGGGEDRHVRAQPVEDPGPVPGGVLVEQRPLRRVEQVEQRTTVAAVALPDAPRPPGAAPRPGVSAVREVVAQLGHPLLLLLPRDAEITDARLAALGHLRRATTRSCAGWAAPSR